ncbi:hypothetical protein [Geopsychrobacter electrodiphilus]|uniref:hypothetical protein n=1 Tax=Geopsychrobacter electrodiphilus TaxID=225196 RepID=UPI00037E1245|nr:hypothetical protein [Geopsychrobacter electrodiphilus]
MTAEAAIAWVDQNAKQIAGHSRKYLPYAPYDQEDFLQDAYEAALEAATVSMERQVFFPACFWTLFKCKISAVTPNPDSKCRTGSSSPPRTTCDWSDFSEERFNQADSICYSEPLFNIDIDQVYPFVRDYLAPKEVQVLEALLGIHGGTMKIKEAARHLGCTPANVRQALNRACQRISLLVASGELDAEFVETEIIKQFEEMLETQKTEENKVVKLDVPSAGNSEKKQPKRHLASRNARRPDSHRSVGTKTHQTPHSHKVIASEHFPGSFIGVPSFPISDRGLCSFGSVPTQEKFMGIQPMNLASSRYDFCLADMTSFVASNNSSTVRSIVICHLRERRQGPVEDVISIFNRKISPGFASSHNNNRNGPITAYSDKKGDDPPITHDRSPPAKIAKRIRNIGKVVRNKTKDIFTDTISSGPFVEQAQFYLAA